MFRIIILLSIISVLFANVSYAKKTFRPKSVEVDFGRTVGNEGLALLNALYEECRNSKDYESIKILDEIKWSINRDKSKKLIEIIKKNRREDVSGNLTKLKKIIDGSLGCSNFLNDEINKTYVFKNDCTGKVVSVPYPPNLYINVSTNITCNNNICAYAYSIDNNIRSDGSVSKIYLENEFSSDFIESIRKLYLNKYKVYEISDRVRQSIWVPRGNLNYFVIHSYDLETNQIVEIKPGDSPKDNFLLFQFDGSEPGLIRGYFPVSGYDLGNYFSGEDEDIYNVMATTPESRTKYMYSSLVIGPDESLGDYTWNAVLSRIKNYYNIAQEFEWFDDMTARFIYDNINLMSHNKNIKSRDIFLEAVTSSSYDGKIPSEFRFILKYYLNKLD